jgi:cold-inducible RNA-binding protein
MLWSAAFVAGSGTSANPTKEISLTHKLFVSNLAESVMEGALRELFSEEGRRVTEVSVITDRATGRSRGFGFVELVTPAEAQAAQLALDGRELDGRAISVREAQPRPRP